MHLFKGKQRWLHKHWHKHCTSVSPTARDCGINCMLITLCRGWNSHFKKLKSRLHLKACTKIFLVFWNGCSDYLNNIPVGLLSYHKRPLISQQLLTIQEELNNKKSELEQAKEEQSHTQALLKVLQEQVSESHGSDPRISSNADTRFPVFDACVNTGWS